MVNLKMEEKMRLVAQLSEGAARSLRSANTAQPWVAGGKNKWMSMELVVQAVHVLDVYIAVCSMQWSTTWLLPFNEKKEISRSAWQTSDFNVYLQSPALSKCVDIKSSVPDCLIWHRTVQVYLCPFFTYIRSPELCHLSPFIKVSVQHMNSVHFLTFLV